ncbi:hypothetical protein EON83_09500 [bacterium]|nr:MAG: hypothetical protein EON83_09500 [bacterium]
MPSSPPQASQCPLCGRLNSTQRPHCRQCGYRLPWADVLEGTPPPPRVADELPAITQKLEKWGALPKAKCACRFCDEPIEIDARQCPHCLQWLAAPGKEILDPWQAGFRDKDVEKTDVISPRAGCFSVLVVLVAGVVWLVGSV